MSSQTDINIFQKIKEFIFVVGKDVNGSEDLHKPCERSNLIFYQFLVILIILIIFGVVSEWNLPVQGAQVHTIELQKTFDLFQK